MSYRHLVIFPLLRYYYFARHLTYSVVDINTSIISFSFSSLSSRFFSHIKNMLFPFPLHYSHSHSHYEPYGHSHSHGIPMRFQFPWDFPLPCTPLQRSRQVLRATSVDEMPLLSGGFVLVIPDLPPR